ncbi:MAG TPA: ABC transporter permease subunit [Propionicimonas sp.]|nr:ABC transporter permease subunit [Propionicimonas sp.]HQD96746.1 ABC transporter permease subunit [Propionicimonas sp.]
MNTWTLSFGGLRTVIELELKQRIRSKRWIWALAGWFVLLGAVTGLIIWAAHEIYSWDNNNVQAGPMAFGVITFFVLGMGLLIAPTFSAMSINGDRAGGTLATLQATRLSAFEIAAGKLLAAWLTAAVFLVVALPFIVWSMVLGNISVWQVLVVFGVVLAEVAVVCAIGLGWSAVTSRPAGSAVMTYLSIAFLTVISTMVMGLLIPMVTDEQPVRVWGLTGQVQDDYNRALDKYWAANPDGDGTGMPAAPIGKCTWFEEYQTVTHADRVWWITVVNPFVIVADAAPLPPGAAKNLSQYQSLGSDPLATIRWGVRQLSMPPQLEFDQCSQYYDGMPGYTVVYDDQGNAIVTTTKGGATVNVESPVKRRVVNVETPIWPWGLAANILIGGVFFWIAVQRLRIPYAMLPKGTRVA